MFNARVEGFFSEGTTDFTYSWDNNVSVCLVKDGHYPIFFFFPKQLAVFRISRLQQKNILHSVVQREQDKAQRHAGLLRSKDVIENGKVMFPARSVSEKSGLNDFK